MYLDMELPVYTTRDQFCLWVMLQVTVEPQLGRLSSKHAISKFTFYLGHKNYLGAHIQAWTCSGSLLCLEVGRILSYV